MSVSKEEFASIASDFLRESEFELLPWEFLPGVREAVINHFASKPWTEEQCEYAVRVSKSLFSCILYFPYASKVSQIPCGILSVYLTLMDDNSTFLGDALDKFTPNMCQGKPQGHPFLQGFVDFLSNDLTFMHPFSQSMVIQDVSNFVAGCLLERDHNRDSIPSTPRAMNFAKYLREKSCIGDAFAYWAFAELTPHEEKRDIYLAVIQDLRIFIGQSNDILSYYKESLDGVEGITYIDSVAKANSITIPEALRMVSADVVQNIKNVRTILAHPDHAEILKIANGVINGFLSWHLHLGRYRLDEVPLVNKDGSPMRLVMNEPRK